MEIMHLILLSFSINENVIVGWAQVLRAVEAQAIVCEGEW
jgi:hypothetical protein